MTEEEVIKDVKKIFSTLSIIAPFSYPLLMMPIQIRNDLTSWAGTNGVTFFVNPDKWSELEFREKLFVGMHEWIHIVMQHAKRMQGRRRNVWNLAADYTTNDLIMNEMEDKFSPPAGILLDQDLFYDKSTEDVYNILLEMIKENEGEDPQCNYCGQVFKENDSLAKDGETSCGVCGKTSKFNIPTPQFFNAVDGVNQLLSGNEGSCDLEQMPTDVDDQEMVDAIIKAAARAKGMKRGFMPGKYEEYVNQLKKSNIPWERLLFRYAKESLRGTTDRNPFRPDPKYLPFDVFIPKEQGRRVGKLVFIVDTSASMGSKEFENVCGHLERLGTLVDKCTVITADTKVQDVFKVKRIKRELAKGKVKFRGRGGTNMTEAFALAEKLDPQLIILYSDMFIGDWPTKPKKAKCIFLATKNSELEESPYGVFIKMSNDR